jgi:hypothetical protein
VIRLLLLAAVAACGADGMVYGDPAAVIGTGELEFEPLGDGDELYVVLGPQGGYHLNGSVRVQGVAPGNPDDLLDPDNPTTEFRAFVGDQRVDAGGARYTQGLDPAPEPHHPRHPRRRRARRGRGPLRGHGHRRLRQQRQRVGHGHRRPPPQQFVVWSGLDWRRSA